MTLPLPDPLVDQREWGEERTGVQRNFETLAQRFPLGPEDLHFGGLTTTLPTSPPEGTIVMYDTGTDGVVWQLRYDSASASAYKWQFIGGPPLRHTIQTDQGTASVPFVDLGTVGPTVTCPLVGEYDLQFGCNIYASAGSPLTGVAAPVAVTDLAAADANGVAFRPTDNNLTNCSVSRMLGVTITAANRVVKLQYHTSAGTAQFRWRWLLVTPVRVG